MNRQRGIQRVLKSAFDRVFAAVLIVVLSPLLLATAFVVRVAIGTPVLFRQERPGRGGRIFELLKFRTMTNARDASGALLPDAQRLTRAGRFLRAWSLDELPQLFNIVRGDFSFVGPRPLLVQYLDRYTPEQMRRHDVMPGITGWAQINGRNAISWEQKFALDLWYVDHWSLALDFRILLATIPYVLRRHGISQAGEATMPEFMGTADDGKMRR
jgi:lipopolysaccharide/colanic/teichoic acid biosynthesis glycosyltransferase